MTTKNISSDKNKVTFEYFLYFKGCVTGRYFNVFLDFTLVRVQSIKILIALLESTITVGYIYIKYYCTPL